MKISIITLFPEVIEPVLNSSILKRAQAKGKFELELINLRNFGEGVHQVVDGRPYGGGVGMVLKANVLAQALKQLATHSRTILTSASGQPYNQAKAQELSGLDHLVIICGHYEGVDQRFIDKYIDEEISIGDYVLTGGEIPAMVIADSVVRLIPEVLKKEATEKESFSIFQYPTSNIQLLEHPHYTRPEEFEGLKVPAVLLSGNHEEVANWRKQKSLEKTQKIRPDLLLKRV